MFTWTKGNGGVENTGFGRFGGDSLKTGGRTGGLRVVLTVSEIEPMPPQRIWFSIVAAQDTVLSNYIGFLPAGLKKRCPRTHVWHFDFQLYDKFVGDLTTDPKYSHLDIIEIPRFLTRGLPIYLKCLPTATEEPKLPPKFADMLLPFQLDGLRFVIRHGGRALIADEMG